MTQPKNKFTEDDNVVYPSAFFQERKPIESSREITAEERQFIEDCLSEYSRKSVSNQERWSIRKRLRQEWNRAILNVHRDEILRSGPVRMYRSEGDIVDKLDQQLTYYTNTYVWKVARELLHQKELERGYYMIDARRFLPEENVKHYLRAKQIFNERLEDVALDSKKEYLEQIETRLYENPLFHYVVARFQRRNKNLRSTDLF